MADPDKKVAEAYGVLMPENGYANRWTFYIGPDGKVLEIDKKVNAKEAGKDVATKLASLGTPKSK